MFYTEYNNLSQTNLVNPNSLRYRRELNLYHGDHYLEFNTNEVEYRLNQYEYISNNLVKSAIDLKTDLIWLNKPNISFNNEKIQEWFDYNATETKFLHRLRQLVIDHYVHGDGLVKIQVKKNKISLVNVNPQMWLPSINIFNLQDEDITHSIIANIEVKDNLYSIVEEYQENKIIYKCYKNGGYGEEKHQVNIASILPNLVENMLVDGGNVNPDGSVSITTDTKMFFRLKNVHRNDSYYGLSEFTPPVISKINAINRYSNLIDVVLVLNSNPILQVNKATSDLYKQTAKEAISSLQSKGLPKTLTEDLPYDINKTAFTVSQLESLKRRVLRNQVLVNDGRGTNNFLNNPFDTAQAREQSNILKKDLMSELAISEVFYNPSVGTNAKSGAAYKALMQTTINHIKSRKDVIKPLMEDIIESMVKIAIDNGLIEDITEKDDTYFELEFKDSWYKGGMEHIQEWQMRVQSGFNTQLDAIKAVNLIDDNEAINKYYKITEELNQEEKNTDNKEKEITES